MSDNTKLIARLSSFAYRPEFEYLSYIVKEDCKRAADALEAAQDEIARIGELLRVTVNGNTELFSTLEVAKAEIASCSACNGSGESTCLSGSGPDAYDVDCQCGACGGTGYALAQKLIAAHRIGLAANAANFAESKALMRAKQEQQSMVIGDCSVSIADLKAERGKLAAELAALREQKPVASIYVDKNGVREFDDWKCPMPQGRTELYTRPAAQPAPQTTPAATLFHDAGAIAQCQYCKRYTLDGKALSDRQPVCTCGKTHGWSGSFVKPGPDAQWHGVPPAPVPKTADPMDWPLPCDVTVGHGTMRKGVALRTLVLRMKSLYEMAIGQNADEVAGRSLGDRKAMTMDLVAQCAQPAQMPGWRLVPVEPTEAMIDAGCEADAKEEATTFNRKRFSDAGVPLKQDFATNGQMLTIRYKAMLAAAPVCDSVQVDQSDDPVVMIAKVAQAVILAADQAGFVVTIERRPLLPLAMGNHVPVVTVWKKRGVT